MSETKVTEPRFEFGRNWQRFLAELDDRQVAAAAQSLERTFGRGRLAGKSFLDVGCGSGLFSLAARQLGASVCSFDFDERSVECARRLKDRYFPGDADWRIESGSALDRSFLGSLGKFDIVYAWGVLHHTGAMRDAWDCAASLVSDGGRLCLSIYNDQGYVSQGWRLIKRVYRRLPRWLRPALVLVIAAAEFARRAATTLAASGLRLCSLRNPLAPWLNWYRESTQRQRGMRRWTDLVDWVGGYPFEVARPEEVFRFFRARGFELTELTTQGGGHGCNEFIFLKRTSSPEEPPTTSP